MAVSKRLRYEVLRRDAFTCRYCHATDVALAVDHVVPVALGGTDEPTNLVTSCQQCNAGKSSSSPDAPIVENVSDDALRWSAAMRKAAEIQSQKVSIRAAYVSAFDEMWCAWVFGDGEPARRPDDWENSIGRFHDLGLPVDVVRELADVALRNRRITTTSAWRYFCGCCWNAITEQQEIAEQLLKEGEVS